MSKENIIIFGDSVGRLIVGQKVGETGTHVSVQCPQVVNVRQDPQNEQRAGIHLLPFCYIDLLDNLGVDYVWEFSKQTHDFNNQVASDAAVSLYKNTLNHIESKVEEQKNEETSQGGQVINMFDK